ncbi:hypothetical protein FRC10_006635 [Ceratobasidium sp. 414]|nr:hypothetical protein FRC10_006635 [Ceratobasidium sp. 414]
MNGGPLHKGLLGFAFIPLANEDEDEVPPIDGEETNHEIQPLLGGDELEQIQDDQQLDAIQNRERSPDRFPPLPFPSTSAFLIKLQIRRIDGEQGETE